MKNTFGQNVCVTLFGESHGAAVGAVMDGLAPGIYVDKDYISERLMLRKGTDGISTARREDDVFEILSGVYNDRTTGTPICLIIRNNDVRDKDYTALRRIPRPGHADYTAECKYHGYEDSRGGGHFSGRITAALTAVGAICLSALKTKNIEIGTHIASVAGINDCGFTDYVNEIKALNSSVFPVLNTVAGEKMINEIKKAKSEGDSVGGVLETAVINLPAGVGEPWFGSVESMLSAILYSVPAVKGVEFGDGFGFAALRGSEANDRFTVGENMSVRTESNRNGGINGGITNGMPLIFRCAVKPTPSIAKEQRTLNLSTGESEILKIEGRHDPAIVHRARAVVDSAAAIALCDLLTTRYGTDYFCPDKEKKL